MKFGSICLTAVLFMTIALAGDLTGQAVVTDGDTIEIHGTKIRIWGVDAVESPQTCFDRNNKSLRCGSLAANALADFIERHVVACNQVDTDRNGRLVAVCSVNGVDIGKWLVRNGWAIDYARYSNGEYTSEQDAARAEVAGNWKYSWQYPENFRACLHRKGGKAEKCSQQD